MWYLRPDGSHVKCKVISVDRSVAPFSYAVMVQGTVRETEAERLAPLDHGAHRLPQNLAMICQPSNNTCLETVMRHKASLNVVEFASPAFPLTLCCWPANNPHATMLSVLRGNAKMSYSRVVGTLWLS